MTQSNFSLPDSNGATFRANVNAALQALASVSSGASEPSTTYAYQLWADTTSGLLKQRNADNDGWIVRGTLAESFVVARSSNTIIGASDFGKVFNFTDTFTQTLTAAATLGDGFYCALRNSGSGVITIDANGSETIDGATTIKLHPGESCILWCNGTGFVTIGRADINALTEDTSPDLGADYVMVYDASAGGLKKVLLGRIGAVHGTPVATTSGTSVTLASGLPAWVKRITLAFRSVSTDGNASLLMHLADAGGAEVSGYSAVVNVITSSVAISTTHFTTGFPVSTVGAGGALKGVIELTLIEESTNTWAAVGKLFDATGTVRMVHMVGEKSLSGPLTGLVLTTDGGGDEFDGGSVSVRYSS